MGVLQDGGGGNRRGSSPVGVRESVAGTKGRSEDDLKRNEMVRNCCTRLSGCAGTAVGCAYSELLLRV